MRRLGRGGVPRATGVVWPLGVLGAVAVSALGAHQLRRDLAQAARRADRAAPAAALSASPSVSILVAAWNESEMIERHIRSVASLRDPRVQYVLCAGGADDTYERAVQLSAGLPNAVVLRQARGEGKQAALRRGFAACTGDVVWLTDADCLVDDEALSRIVAPLAQGWAAAATGSSRPLDDQLRDPLARYQWYREVYWHLRDGVWADGLLGRNAAVARGLLEESRALDADVPTGTDYHLSGVLRGRGVRIANTRGEVRSQVPTDLAAYRRMWRRWTKNLIAQGATSGRAGEAAQAAIAVGAAVAVLGGPLWLLFGRSGLILWILLCARGWAERARQCYVAGRLLGRTEGPGFYLRLWVYYVVDCLAVASAPVDLVRSSWRARW